MILAMAVPPAAAGNYAAGTTVTKYDYDYFPKPGSVTNSLCFFDADSNGAHNGFEAIIIDIDTATCATTTEVDDIRLTAHDSFKSFSAVKTGDADWNNDVVTLAGTTLIYFDENGNGKFDNKDTLYLDIVGVGDLKVNVGDLRLTAFGTLAAASFVKAGDPDIAYTLPSFGAAFTDANVFYKAGSAYYINADKGTLGTSDVGVEDGDVRILAKAPDPLAWNSSDVNITGLATSPTNPTAGSPFQVVVDVKNAGKEPAARFLETKWGSAVVDARSTPILPPGTSTKIVISLPAPANAGTVDLTVADKTTAVTIDPGADVVSLKVAALEHELETLKAQLLTMGIDVETGAPLEVQAQEVENAKAPGPDAALAVIAVGLLVAFMSRRRTA